MEVFHWRANNVAVGQIANRGEVGELHCPVDPFGVKQNVECARSSKVNPQNGARQGRKHILDIANAIDQGAIEQQATQFRIVLAGFDRWSHAAEQPDNIGAAVASTTGLIQYAIKSTNGAIREHHRDCVVCLLHC